MRVALRLFLSLVMAAGLILALWPLGQTAYGTWNQRQLAAQFGNQTRQPKAPQNSARRGSNLAQTSAKPSQKSRRNSEDSPVLVAQEAPARKKSTSWPLTKLSIADIGLETFVVQGMDEAALKRGPGHDVNSSLPGVGNCVVAGHRNVYGSFFYRLDELLPGAPIVLENRDGKFTYIVDAVFTTSDTDLTVLKTPPPDAAPLLTLITCTLPHTNNRIILQARSSTE